MAPILTRLGQSFGFGASSGSSPNQASGGTKIPAATAGNAYTYHVFLHPTTGGDGSNFVVESVSDGGFNAEFLVIAGGASGGGRNTPMECSGGGGAGGLRTNATNCAPGGPGTSAEPDYPMSVGTVPVTVGAGGAKFNAPNASPGYPGGNSVFGTITSTGGGAGGGNPSPPGGGQTGGSGGGARYNATPTDFGPAATPVQGHVGGSPNASSPSVQLGGGGGGAGGLASDYGGSNSVDAMGGPGKAAPAFPNAIIGPAIPAPVRPVFNAVVGTSGVYAGGGGGGGPTGAPAPGGPGGGGSGNWNSNGGDGVHCTGSGGGGSGSPGSPGSIYNGAGGNGIVIVRYQATA